MRRLNRVLFAMGLMLIAGMAPACGGPEEGAEAAAEGVEGEAAAEGDKKADDPKADDKKVAEATAEGAKAEDPKAAVKKAEGAEPGETVATARPTAEECKKACDKALKITMAEFPKDAKAEMRETMEKTLTEDCPKHCVTKGTKASVACVLAATAAADMAKCPQ